MTEKKGFLKNFTWKWFVINSIIWFVATLSIAVLMNYFDESESVRKLFSCKELISRLTESVLSGFLFTIWMGPFPKKEIKP